MHAKGETSSFVTGTLNSPDHSISPPTKTDIRTPTSMCLLYKQNFDAKTYLVEAIEGDGSPCHRPAGADASSRGRQEKFES